MKTITKGIATAMLLMALTPVSAHADASAFTDNGAGGAFVVSPYPSEPDITIDFDQDGTACGGTATEWHMYLNAGSIGYGDSPRYDLQATTTLIAEHVTKTIDVQAAHTALQSSPYYPGYVNIIIDYSTGGVVCGTEASTGFGEQNWGYAVTLTGFSYTRNAPGITNNGARYDESEDFDIVLTAPPVNPGEYPTGATDYQLRGGGMCFPAQPIGSGTSFTGNLPAGDYSNMRIMFSADASVDGDGCLNGATMFSWPDTAYDSFVVDDNLPITADPTYNVLMYGVVLFMAGFIFPIWMFRRLRS